MIGIGGLKDAGKEQMVKRVLDSDRATQAIELLVEAELTLVESVREQHDALGIDVIDADALPSKEDRSAQLQELALAKVDGRIPEHFVETYLDEAIDNAEDAAEYAALSDEEWTAQKGDWAAALRKNEGLEGSDEAIAKGYIQTHFGVSHDQFYELVVHWPDGREEHELQGILAGGVKLANRGINATTQAIEAADVDLPDDFEAELEDDE